MFSKSNFSLPIKIGDFGFCRLLPSGTECLISSLISRVGTEGYMAPEIFSNDCSFQADLFSLGLIIWEVYQLIQFPMKRIHFDRLVNDRDENVVEQYKHTKMNEVPKLIVHLTKKVKAERLPNIQEVVTIFDRWGTNCPLVNSAAELVERLKNAKIREKIVLSEGVYELTHFTFILTVKIKPSGIFCKYVYQSWN